METVVIVIHLMVVLALVLVVLLQRSEGGALGMGGGNSGFMSSRGTANVLTRATALLAVAFFGTSLALSLIARMGDSPASVLDNLNSGASAPATAPANGEAPASGNGILDTLKQQSQPSGPQVPTAQ